METLESNTSVEFRVWNMVFRTVPVRRKTKKKYLNVNAAAIFLDVPATDMGEPCWAAEKVSCPIDDSSVTAITGTWLICVEMGHGHTVVVD